MKVQGPGTFRPPPLPSPCTGSTAPHKRNTHSLLVFYWYRIDILLVSHRYSIGIASIFYWYRIDILLVSHRYSIGIALVFCQYFAHA